MVIPTHLHADHFWVTHRRRCCLFPNARVIRQRADLHHLRQVEGWLADRVRDGFLPSVELARVDLVEESGKLAAGIGVEVTTGRQVPSSPRRYSRWTNA